MQTYANLCALAALVFYAFTDVKFGGKAARFLSIMAVVAYVVTEGIVLIA